MNEQRLDELFREKLAGYSEVPPPEAGKKLNNQLVKQKRNVWIQLVRVAAALVLIAISVYVVRSWNDTANDDSIQQATTSTESARNATEEIPQPGTPLSEKSGTQKINTLTPKEPGGKTPIKETNVQNSTKPSEHQLPVSELAQPALALINNPKDVSRDESNGEPIENEQVIDSVTSISKPSKPKVTITYIKSPAPPEPTLALQTPSENKTKGFKRLWRKAQRINYNDISLAGIRGTKDQILAFDRKDKTKESKSN